MDAKVSSFTLSLFFARLLCFSVLSLALGNRIFLIVSTIVGFLQTHIAPSLALEDTPLCWESGLQNGEYSSRAKLQNHDLRESDRM